MPQTGKQFLILKLEENYSRNYFHFIVTVITTSIYLLVSTLLTTDHLLFGRDHVVSFSDFVYFKPAVYSSAI